MARARSRTSRRILEAVNAMCNLSHTEAGEEPIVFVELDTRQDAGYTVSLEWDRDTDDTQIVLADSRTACLLVFAVSGAIAGDAFRHPFRYAP
jgi:carotenoid cleavage dioxygenase-like enzyme